MYYSDKIKTFEDIFGIKNVRLEPDFLIVNDKKYPVISDVIILSEPGQYTDFVRRELQIKSDAAGIDNKHFAKDIQYTLGLSFISFISIILPNLLFQILHLLN